MSTSIARITEYWLDGSVHTYEMTRAEVRLHMAAIGARVTVSWQHAPEPVKEPADAVR
jgi:hypothetical protein